MPKAGRDVLPKVGSLVEGPAAYGHLSGQANLVLLDASGRHPGGPWAAGGATGPTGPGAPSRSSAWARSGGDRSARTPSVCVNGSASRPRCCASPSCWSSTSRRTALTPKGSARSGPSCQQLHEAGTTIFLSSHLLAEVDQLCTRIGLLDRGRLVIQESLSTLRAPTGRTVVETSDVDAGETDPRTAAVEAVDGERLMVRSADPAGVNARLVAAGVAVRELGPERRTLEQVIEERTSARPPGEVRPMIRVELTKLFGRRRTWVAIGLLNLLPTLVCVLLAWTRIAPAPGQGPAFLSAVIANGSLFAIAALAIVLPLFLPIAVAVVAGDAVAGEAQAGTLRYLLVRPVGRTRLLVAKLVAIVVFVLVGVVSVTLIGFVVGHFLLGDAPLSQAMVSISGSVLTPGQVAWRTVAAVLLVTFSMLGVAAMALFLSTTTDSPLSATLGRAGLPHRLVAAADHRRRAAAPALPADPVLAVVRGPLPRPDPVEQRQRGIGLQAVYVGVLLVAAWANFTTQDVTS